MNIVYDDEYKRVYSEDPASAPGRIECILEALGDLYPFADPLHVSADVIRQVHTQGHLDYVERLGLVFEMAFLAVGGAVKAAELAMQREPAFALVRPPGHHASGDSSWGFCYFNNVAVAVEKLRTERKIESAVILDFDLHFGDGTSNIFSGVTEVAYYHAPREDTVDSIRDYLNSIGERDIIAVSAGFDRHELDWGGMLKTEDYERIGGIVKDYAERNAQRRYFSVLEGGYNQRVLGKNVAAFLEGMR